jgi:hypothetical protein
MSSLISVVEKIVDEKVQANEMFTAHDVTLEARNRGHRAFHNEVRDAVHDYYGRGGLGVAYARTNISVPGGNPYLYHPTTSDPSTYGNIRGGGTINVPPPASQSTDGDDDDDDGLNQAIQIPSGLVGQVPQSVAGVAVAVVAQPKVNVNRNANTGKLQNRTADARGTLSIPSPVIRRLGLNPGDKVYAVQGGNGTPAVEVHKNKPLGIGYSTYTVDCNSQVRITKYVLSRSLGSATFDISEETDKVVVKAH